jgi:hypothetical protein
MNTCVHLRKYLPKCLLEFEMFHTKVVEKLNAQIYVQSLSISLFFWKSFRLRDNVGKRCKAGHSTDDNRTQRMRFACWITRAIDTHSEYVILSAFPLQQWLQERASVPRYMYIACLDLCDGYGRSSLRAGNELICLYCANFSLEMIADHITRKWRATHWACKNKVQSQTGINVPQQ